jgi:hypothetical protein
VDRSNTKKTLEANEWPYGKDRILDIERGRSNRSHNVVNWLW